MQNRTRPVNDQDAFNRVWDYFVVKNNKPSRNEEACLYRFNGKGCAIGCMLPDRLAKKADSLALDDSSINIVIKKFPEIASWFAYTSPLLLKDLQKAHDSWQYGIKKEDKKESLRKVADKWFLAIPGERVLVYKVVSAYLGRLFSGYTFLGRAFDNKLVLEYKEGVETFPKFGKIFAFSSEQEAREFSAASPVPKQVWLAYAPSAKQTDMQIAFLNDNDEAFEAVWKKTKKFYLTKYSPTGTVLCPSLTLAKRLR